MEADRSAAARHRMSSPLTTLATCVVAAWGVAVSPLPASPACAGRSGTDEAVRAGADGYTPWGNSPTGDPTDGNDAEDPQNSPSDGLGLPCHADGMGGCVVPVCGDPLGSGECRMPTVTITVTAFRPASTTPPGVITVAERGDGLDRTGAGTHAVKATPPAPPGNVTARSRAGEGEVTESWQR